jgi:FlaA1/EpsC-like NDP-sugar epimerase
MTAVSTDIGLSSPADFFAGKRVVVTGGGGSVGIELVKQLLAMDVEIVRVVDNNESALFDLEQRLRDPRLQALYCDIRDEHELNRTFSAVEVCFHAAALKHVPSCELSPFGAVQTNIIGSQQVIRAALRNGLTHVLFTSSDKAVNPTNVMGTTKLMGERLFTAANALSEGQTRCIFGSTRFGNVAGSRGSVIPLFCDQLRDGRGISLTDPRMTRFIMTLQDAAQLVIQTMPLLRGGEIFVTKMAVVSIESLARVMVKMIAPVYGRIPGDVVIEYTGPRPGEKLWEELNTDEEARRTFDFGSYLVVLPALRNFYETVTHDYLDKNLKSVERLYHSANETHISDAEIEAFLLKPGVLPADVRARLV